MNLSSPRFLLSDQSDHTIQLTEDSFQPTLLLESFLSPVKKSSSKPQLNFLADNKDLTID